MQPQTRGGRCVALIFARHASFPGAASAPRGRSKPEPVLQRVGERISGDLAEMGIEIRMRKIYPRGLLQDDRDMFLNWATLVPRESTGAVHARLDRANTEYSEYDVSFSISGPCRPIVFAPHSRMRFDHAPSPVLHLSPKFGTVHRRAPRCGSAAGAGSKQRPSFCRCLGSGPNIGVAGGAADPHLRERHLNPSQKTLSHSMRFGCLLDDPATVTRLLHERDADFQRILVEISGLRRTGHSRAAGKMSQERWRASGISRLPDRSRTCFLAEGREYLASRRRHYDSIDEEGLKRQHLLDRFRSDLSGLFLQCRVDEHRSPIPLLPSYMRLVSFRFLVHRTLFEEFIAMAESSLLQIEEWSFLGGPCPPYSFVSV